MFVSYWINGLSFAVYFFVCGMLFVGGGGRYLNSLGLTSIQEGAFGSNLANLKHYL